MITKTNSQTRSIFGLPVPQTHGARLMIGLALVLAAIIPILAFGQEAAETEAPKVYYGWLSLIPPIIVVIAAIIMRRAFEPLVIGRPRTAK